MYLDPQIRNWVFIPIMLVMILVGILRHNGMQLLQSPPKPDIKQLRESACLLRVRTFRSLSGGLAKQAYEGRKEYFVKNMHSYLKNPNAEATNPMSDPGQMEGTMEMMKKNMMMIVPQTLIMSWISFFFSGFILTKLPFPLTLRFKAMLQSGIETQDMDVTWVSSISWYFLNLFGLNSVYTLLLGDSSTASGSMDMMQMQQMSGSNPMAQPSEAIKTFKSEAEFLELHKYKFRFEDIEDLVLEKYGKKNKKTK
ncbi:ER membrane complex subunit 3 [Boothiomyces sp. JEL0838]|nr:ER membrane complex subunit 3 [Boothiomyces sp. JEL0838]